MGTWGTGQRFECRIVAPRGFAGLDGSEVFTRERLRRCDAAPQPCFVSPAAAGHRDGCAECSTRENEVRRLSEASFVAINPPRESSNLGRECEFVELHAGRQPTYPRWRTVSRSRRPINPGPESNGIPRRDVRGHPHPEKAQKKFRKYLKRFVGLGTIRGKNGGSEFNSFLRGRKPDPSGSDAGGLR